MAQIIFKLREEDKKLIEEAAYINRMSVSVFIRNIMIGEALAVVGIKGDKQ